MNLCPISRTCNDTNVILTFDSALDAAKDTKEVKGLDHAISTIERRIQIAARQKISKYGYNWSYARIQIEGEIWLQVTEHFGKSGFYFVSSHGRVKNKHDRFISTNPRDAQGGYSLAAIMDQTGKQRMQCVHRLVYCMFKNDGQPLEDGLVINHLDGDKSNNTLLNLEACTKKEGYRDKG